MKIITLSDSPARFTGLARVHRHAIDALIEAGHTVLPCVWFGYDEIDLQAIAKGKKPPELWYDSKGTSVRMISVPKRDRQRREIGAMYDVIEAFKPDAVLTIGDYFDFYYMSALKIKTDFSFKWIPYLTMETEDIERTMLPLFRYADALVVPTRFGQKVLEKKTNRSVEFLPYGIDDCFRVLPDDERRNLRAARGCSDKIRFITVAQNTARKNLPALLQAVSLIDDPERRLQFYVHTNVDACDRQEASMFDLRGIAERLGVSDRIVFPESVSLFSAPSDEDLVREYNASDFFVTPSNSEGFGLPIVEAMACGLPVAANGAFVMAEHLGKTTGCYETVRREECGLEMDFGPTERGWAVENRLEIYPRDIFARIIEPKALAKAILALAHASPEKVSTMKENSIKYAKEHKWELMKKGLCRIVEGTEGPVSLPVEILEGNKAGLSY